MQATLFERMVQSVRTETRESLTIVLASTQALWHGGEEQAALLADGLRERGHEVHLLARKDGEFARRMTAKGWPVRQFAGRGRMPHAIWAIRRWLRDLEPDVLHYNDPHALTSCGLASLGLEIPLRVAARRVDFPLRSPLRYRYLTDAVICVSRAVRDMCVRGGLPESHVHLVHDGVNPERASAGNRLLGRRSLQVDPATTVLLTVAKLTEHKGHVFFLDALPALVRKHPRLLWVIAGDGPLRQKLETQVRIAGLQQHVRFLGYRQDIPDLLAAADLLVVPSYLEGLCSTIVDAMLVGCPIVATTAGGIPDLLSPRDTFESSFAWLVPPRDPQAMAEAVTSALRSPERRAMHVQRASERARCTFTATQMVDQTLDVYRQMLGQSHTGTAPTQRLCWHNGFSPDLLAHAHYASIR